MQHSDQPYRELTRAREAIECLRAATTFEGAEEAWKEYLSRIERAWYKAKAHFRRSPKWDSWQGKYDTLRKKDALLRYLVNARGADEHTIADITRLDPAHHHIDAGPEQEHLVRWEPQPNGEIIVELGPGAKIMTRPATMRLLNVDNRGVLYEVPMKHLGVNIDPTDIVGIAEKGLFFYENFLHAAEKFFVTSQDQDVKRNHQ